jgi:hypothetical protein
METFFMNPLSRRLCELHGGKDALYVVKDIRETPEGWELEMG